LKIILLFLALLCPIAAVSQITQFSDMPPSYRRGNIDVNDSTDFYCEFIRNFRPGIQVGRPNTLPVNNIELVFSGSTLWSYITDIIIGDGLAYCTMPNGLKIIDVRAPANPTLVSQTYMTGKVPLCLAKEENQIYAGIKDSGLCIFDITNPNKPKLIGRYVSNCTPNGIAVSNEYAFLCCPTQFEIVDLSNIASPILVSTLPIASEYYPTGIKVEGNYAYIANGKLWIIDISNITEPKEILSEYATLNLAADLVVRDTLLFVADKDYSFPINDSYLSILDISDLSSPELISYSHFYGASNYIKINESYACISAAKGGIVIYDISSPTEPIMTGCYKSPDRAGPFDLIDDNLFLADNYDNFSENTAPPNCESSFIYANRGDLQIIDISDKSLPSLIGSYATPGYSSQVKIFENYCFVVHDRDIGGISIVDISNSNNMENISFIETTGSYLEDIAIKESYLYAIDFYEGLQIIDISNIESPITVGHYDLPLGISDIEIKANHAYFACGYSGLYILDISDIANPVFLGSCATQDVALNVAVRADYAYIADRRGGVQIINISNPIEPAYIGTYYYKYNPESSYAYITIKGNKAFLGGITGHFEIVDITNPISPSYISSLTNLGEIRCLTISENYAFFAIASDGINIVDISNLENPFLSSHYITNGLVLDMDILDDNIYVADFYSLLDLRPSITTNIKNDGESDLELPNISSLGPNYPNPFNASTTIEYSLQSRTHVEIAIFNLLGRKIKTILYDVKPAGKYLIRWDGTDESGQPVASGIYFYQLTTDGFPGSKKMVLLK